MSKNVHLVAHHSTSVGEWHVTIVMIKKARGARLAACVGEVGELAAVEGVA